LIIQKNHFHLIPINKHKGNKFLFFLHFYHCWSKWKIFLTIHPQTIWTKTQTTISNSFLSIALWCLQDIHFLSWTTSSLTDYEQQKIKMLWKNKNLRIQCFKNSAKQEQSSNSSRWILFSKTFTSDTLSPIRKTRSVTIATNVQNGIH
jgi:hypothetical protein